MKHSLLKDSEYIEVTGNILLYKTHPLNPDTDFDGQNDYNDPVPLDYDMDGDGYINDGGLVFSGWSTYVERLAIAANNDPNILHWPSDNDMDDDGLPWNLDPDDDADGMSDDYEKKYGSAAVAANIVNGQGWQHPWIHNARYAVVVGGDILAVKDGTPDTKVPMFWNDIKGMYDALLSKGWNDENIYVLFFNGYNHDGVNPSGIIDGAIIYENWVSTISLLKNISTKNDLLLFTATGHGAYYSFGISVAAGVGSVFSGIKYDIGKSDPGGGYLSELHQIPSARLVVVIEACYSGGAIRNNQGFGSITPLMGPNIIIVTASRIDRKANYYYNDPTYKIFLGAFVTKLKESNVNIYDAFKSGEQATDDSSLQEAREQDPQIEDNGDCLTSQNNDPNINSQYFGGEYIPHTAVDGDQASKTYV